MTRAPHDWFYFSFPLSEEGDEAISFLRVTEIGHGLMDDAERIGDQTPFAPVPHWAHMLKVAQGPGGDWPVWVNAKTGEEIGNERTYAPATLLERLGRVLRSTEFEAVVERAVNGAGSLALSKERQP